MMMNQHGFISLFSLNSHVFLLHFFFFCSLFYMSSFLLSFLSCQQP